MGGSEGINEGRTTTVPKYWNDNDNGGYGGDDDENNGDNDDADDDGNDDDNNVGGRNATEKPNETGELSDECRLARALARERPYCVPMEAVDAFVIGSDFEDYLKLPNKYCNQGGTTTTTAYDESNAGFYEQQQLRNRIFRALNGSIVACVPTHRPWSRWDTASFDPSIGIGACCTFWFLLA